MAVTTTRADALLPTADLGQASAVYNDATRLLEGGLWQQPANEGNQTPTLGTYVADMNALAADAQLAATQAAGTPQAAELTQIASLSQTLSAAATTALNSHGAAHVTAETTLHDAQLQIQSIVANDPTLAAASTANGAPGFIAAPAQLPAGMTAATAPHATLADIGTLFNDAANHLVGGINDANKSTIQADLKAAATGLHDLITNNPGIFTNGQAPTDGQTTLIHAQTIENQLNLEIHQLDTGHFNGTNARAINDNMLDIIDIVQGDPQLQAAATANGANGFSAFGDFLHGTTNKYQDTPQQTQFWANFITGANNLSTQASTLVGSHDTAAVNTLISQIQQYEKSGAQFEASQGGIFAARFANELGAHDGTLAADGAAMIKGLQTGNAAMVQAAGQGMIADAADVSGNNVPVGGGTYNGTGTTVAQVLSTAGTSLAQLPAGGGNGTTMGMAAGGNAMTPPLPLDPGHGEIDVAHLHSPFHADHWG